MTRSRESAGCHGTCHMPLTRTLRCVVISHGIIRRHGSHGPAAVAGFPRMGGTYLAIVEATALAPEAACATAHADPHPARNHGTLTCALESGTRERRTPGSCCGTGA